MRTGEIVGNNSLIVKGISSLFKKWEVEAADDNQADACAMGYMAEAIWRFSKGEDLGDWAKYQIETVKKVVSERPKFNID
jgi:hypothetical protein